MATNHAAALEVQGIEVPAPGIYQIDASHSTAGFIARHLMVAKVRGRFSEVTGTVEIGETPEVSRVDVTIGTASVDTGDAKRDEHLRSPDFFNVEAYPQMRFVSTEVRQTGETELEIDGDLTIREVTAPVTLYATYEGLETSPWGDTRVGFSAVTDVDREAWGLTWNVALESGGVLVGRKVKLEIDVELVKA